MIELAPDHKIGLPVENPVLLAGGTIGYGEACHAGLALAKLGGVVVGPVMRHGTAGNAPPRYAPVGGGMVLESGLQNRGVSAVLRRFGRSWPSLGCPVIVQIGDSHPDFAGKAARRIHETAGVSGIELLLPAHADKALTQRLVQALVRAGDLPILVKLPLHTAHELAAAAVESGAVGLTVGSPLAGAAFSRQSDGTHQPVRGGLYGPTTYAPMLDALLRVAALDLPAALVACGGIHTVDEARHTLAAGATAFQLDSAVWVEPGLPEQLVDALSV